MDILEKKKLYNECVETAKACLREHLMKIRQENKDEHILAEEVALANMLFVKALK